MTQQCQTTSAGLAQEDDHDCDIFVTTVFQREGLSGLIGQNESNVTSRSFKRLASGMKIYHYTKSSGTSSPLTGIKNSQQNKEGNLNNQVCRNTYRIDMAISVDLQPLAIINKGGKELD